MKRLLITGVLVIAATVAGLWAYAGSYGLHVVARHGGTYWLPVSIDSPRLSPSVRLALGQIPSTTSGPLKWRAIAEGFDVADLSVLADGHEVDRILLARIDPAHFRFAVFNGSAGDKDLDQWMVYLGAALVVNGSYYNIRGMPDTPFVTDGVALGPHEYDAKAGAFVASTAFTGIRDLEHEDWQAAFSGAHDAMVSYPMLIKIGRSNVEKQSRWLANRSFVATDGSGRIIIGTTKDAFFSLDRLAQFLQDSPLGLKSALNLDGGPVASQAVSLNGYERKTYGRWEIEVDGDRAKLLTWPYGTVAMPVVLAVFPK